ncbi:MAG: ribulose phosphate epimerase [Myxococcota bacterium]
MAIGCGTQDNAGAEDGNVDGGATPAEETNGDDTLPMNGTAEDTGGNDDTPVGTSGGADEGSDDGPSNFIMEPDGGGPNNECDIWAQDCPEGEKCMPWDNSGGSSWNATRCSPIEDNPGQPGDTCTVEGSGVSGIDSCDLASMCWDVDGETNMGTCVGFCEGSPEAPLCSDPDEACSITNDGVLILCLPLCDPLLQDCAEGQACYPEENGFICSPDASGPDLGAIGDPCEFINVCDPGGWCAAADVVPGCVGSIGCCAAYCDITDPNATENCMPDMTECTPWHDEGTAPPGEEDIGVCILPQN